jgi:uncharacterized damage-inducible protein DinB
MAETMTGRPEAYTAAQRSEKARFRDMYTREHATTAKVLAAYPQHKAGLKAHERSSSAHQIAWTFVVEEALILKALRNEDFVGGGFPQAPESWDAVIAAFHAQHDEILDLLRDSTNPDLEGTTRFYTVPKQIGEYPLAEFLTFMLHDQIHHRGQLSVYLRLAGAKVPSIYGPSADEPWN